MNADAENPTHSTNAARHNGQPGRLADGLTVRGRAAHGISIALLGPDGSGKSTIARALSDDLAIEMFQGVDYFHASFGILPLLKTFKRPFRRRDSQKTGNAPLSDAASSEVAQPRNPWLSLVYVLYYSLDYALGSWRMKRATAAGRLLILDRCIYDYFLQRQHGRIPRWLLRTIVRLLPKPDLVVFLEGDPEVVYRRKPELPAEEIQRQNDVMARLCAWMSNTVRLRTDRPTVETLSELEVLIRGLSRNRHGGIRS